MSLDNFVFPHDVEGWLSEAEGRALAELARDKTVLELGTFKGRSTICMAQTAKVVWTIDTHYHGSLLDFMANIARYGMSDKVIPLMGRFNKMTNFLRPIFDIAFIDGGHTKEETEQNTRLADSILNKFGILIWHDYGHPEFPAVKEVVDDYRKRMFAPTRGFRVIDTLAILQTDLV